VAKSYPEFKVYRSHGCGETHQTYADAAKCIWPQSSLTEGEGSYALVASCSGTEVSLYDSPESAKAAKQVLDADTCGDGCHRRHEIIQLDLKLPRP